MFENGDPGFGKVGNGDRLGSGCVHLAVPHGSQGLKGGVPRFPLWLPAEFGRRLPDPFSEHPAERLGTLVAISQGDLDDPALRSKRELMGSTFQAAQLDVLMDADAEEFCEPPVEMIFREGSFAAEPIQGQGFIQMAIDVFQ
jgi:hypothetical protein